MFKKIIYLVVITFTIIGTQSCKDNMEAVKPEIQLSFIPTYDNTSLVNNNERMVYNGDTEILLTLFKFYMTDLKIVLEDKSELSIEPQLWEVTLIENSYAHELKINVPLDRIDVRGISSIKFDIGVPPDLNSLTPQQQEYGSILNSQKDYWSAWKSYIFSKTEGKTYTPNENLSFSFHTGANETFTPVNIVAANSIIPDENGVYRLHLNVDIAKVMVDDQNNKLDLTKMAIFHEENQLEAMKKWTKNIANAFNIVAK